MSNLPRLRRFLAVIVYVPLQIIGIPFALLGLILILNKQILLSKKLGVSATAVEVISVRWLMHLFGLREDVVAAGLHRILPNNSILGFLFIFFPHYVCYRLTGQYVGYPSLSKNNPEKITNLIITRTLYMDRILAHSIQENSKQKKIDQLVIMGAGHDTRSYGPLQQKVQCFEIDKANTQRLKVSCLKKAGIDFSHVRFIAADFSQDDWWQKLLKAGFSSHKRSFFLWEGVSYYLSEKDLRKALRYMRKVSAAGSTVVMDIYPLSLIRGDFLPILFKPLIRALKITNEEFKFALDFSTNNVEKSLSTFFASEQYTVTNSFLMGGQGNKGPFMAIVELTI